MLCACHHSARRAHKPLRANARRRRDPTRTATLRSRFEADLIRRFSWLRAVIKRGVLEVDMLDLAQLVTHATPSLPPDIGDLFPPDQVPVPRFVFERSSQKVGAFTRWLDGMAQQGILGTAPGMPLERAAEQAWTSTYIQRAYKRGIDHAGSELRGAGADVSDRWIDAAFDRPHHADAVGLAYTRMYEQLDGITSDMSHRMSSELARGLALGKSPREIEYSLRGILGDKKDKAVIARARRLARTEVIAAHAEATINAYEEAGAHGVDVEVETLLGPELHEDAPCEECQAVADGGPYTLEEARGLIPVHPNCLPGDSLVTSIGGISAVSKRVYDGDLIVIRTASGRSVACTPNHPILSDGKWVPAQLLDCGHNVISYGTGHGAPIVHNNGENMPARIHDVSESFRRSRGVSAREVVVSTPDFHGDGMDGDVAVVWSYGELWDMGDSSTFQGSRKLHFGCGHKRRGVDLARLGALAFFLKRYLASARRGMSAPDLIGSLFGAHLLPLDRLCFALVSGLDSSADYERFNGLPSKREPFRDAVDGLTSEIRANNVLSALRDKLFAGHVVGSKQSNNDLSRDSVLARQLASGSAGPVFRDKIVAVDVRSMCGHVYNLETGSGSFVADGIITHNCRCGLRPRIKIPRGGLELR